MKAAYLRHVGTLAGGTVVAQLLNLLAYPFLTRSYSPEAWGQFALFLSTASIVGTVACGRFDIVVQAAPRSRRFALHRLGLVICAAVSVVTMLAGWLLSPLAGAAAPLFALLLGLATFLTGYTLSAQALLIKDERFARTSSAAMVRTLLTVAPQIALFWLLPGPFGLIAGYCIGALFQALFQRQAFTKINRRSPGRRHLLALLRRYRAYPLFDLPSALVATASLYAAAYLVFDLYGAAEAGRYAIAFRLAALPLALVASNLAEVYFQRAARAREDGTPLWPLMRFVLLVSGSIATVTGIAILLVGEPIVAFYLGKEFAAVGRMLEALVPMMMLRLISVALGPTPLVLGKPHWALWANAALLLTLLASWLAARRLDLSVIDFLWTTSLSSAAVYALYILFLTAAIGRPVNRTGRAIRPASDR